MNQYLTETRQVIEEKQSTLFHQRLSGYCMGLLSLRHRALVCRLLQDLPRKTIKSLIRLKSGSLSQESGMELIKIMSEQ